MIRRRLLILICLVPGVMLMIVLHTSAMEAGVSFAIMPGAGSVDVGSSFTVTLQVQTHGQSIDGAEIHIDFDPALLEVISTVPGTMLPVQIVPPSFDNGSGRLDYAAGTFSDFPNASFDLLTITFKAKATGTSMLRLPASDIPRRSELTFAGISLINLTAPIELSNITINRPPAQVGPTLSIRTEPITAEIAQNINVHLELAQVRDLYGLDVTCVVNPSILIGAERVDGTVFKADNSFFVDRGFQADGRWNVAVSLLNPSPVFEGNGTAFNLRYIVVGMGTTPINCQVAAVNASGFSVPITIANGAFSNESVQPVFTPEVTLVPPTTALPTQNPIPVPTNMSVPQPNSVQGTVHFQARSDSSGIMLTLLSGGPTGAILGQTETGSDGAFQFNNLTPGVYSLQFMGKDHLQLVKTISVTAEEGMPLQIILRAGDTNGDQSVDLTDAALVGANFYMSVPPSPTSADLNRDGVVNISDLALIGGNFGLVGPLNE
jgi:dockerin type I repeat protein/cohesin domain-containing protein